MLANVPAAATCWAALPPTASSASATTSSSACAKASWRVRLRTASYANVQAMGAALPGTALSELPAAVGSFLFVVGDLHLAGDADLTVTGGDSTIGTSANSNFSAGMTIFRYFNAGTGVADPVEDSLWTATKVKGTSLWIYVRETGKLETAAWATADEIYLGGKVLTDLPQKPSDAGGYIKRRIPLEPQSMYPDIAAA